MNDEDVDIVESEKSEKKDTSNEIVSERLEELAYKKEELNEFLDQLEVVYENHLQHHKVISDYQRLI